MPAAIYRSCPVGPTIGDAEHLRAFEARLAAEDKSLEKAERKGLYANKILKLSISEYRRNLDRISLGKAYANKMSVSLISVLAELDGQGGNKTKTAIRKMRDERVLAKFGVLKVE